MFGNRIGQAYVSSHVSFFKNSFLKRNGLIDYCATNLPSIFFGARGSSDIINKHTGYKIILPATPNDYPDLNNYDKTIFICSDDYQLPNGVIRKSLTPEIKDYSLYKPSVMGDKIYIYSGFKNGWNHYSDLIKEIQKRVDFEIVTTNHSDITDYHSPEFLKEEYYDKCFINLNLTDGNGLGTTIELGLMGRKTIFKNKTINSIQRLDFPNFISYETIEDIVNIINNESKKIGTTQPPINAHNVGDEWLNLDFWL
jgi:hypothetical protein